MYHTTNAYTDRWPEPPPFAHCGLKKKTHWGDIEPGRTSHKVSTTSQFGTPNGVLYCSLSPQKKN